MLLNPRTLTSCVTSLLPSLLFPSGHAYRYTLIATPRTGESRCRGNLAGVISVRLYWEPLCLLTPSPVSLSSSIWHAGSATHARMQGQSHMPGYMAYLLFRPFPLPHINGTDENGQQGLCVGFRSGVTYEVSNKGARKHRPAGMRHIPGVSHGPSCLLFYQPMMVEASYFYRVGQSLKTEVFTRKH